MNKKAYINNKFIDNDKKLEIFNPYNNKVIGTVPNLSTDQIITAFTSAKNAFKMWSTTPVSTRIDTVLKIKKALLDNIDLLSQTLCSEVGKNINDCVSEIKRSAEYVDETITSYLDITKNKIIYDKKQLKTKDKTAIFEYVPLGTVFAIPPFNYPINLLVAKIAPALLTGNCVVFKSATQGSLTTSILIEKMNELGLPVGILNHITCPGEQIDKIIGSDLGIKMITFTGSSEVGEIISSKTSMIPLTLELGGKDAAIVLDDAQLEKTAKEIVKGAMSYSGQRCTAIKRVLVSAQNKTKLIEHLVQHISNLTVGDPMDANNIIGPLINKKSVDYNIELLNDAIANNATLHHKIKTEGNILYPVLVSNITPDARIAWEEPFGPILPVIEYDSIQNAIDICNFSEYGLQTSIFTSDMKKAEQIANQLEVGTVNINKSSARGPDILPFLGVKKSGLGVQGITDAIYSMTRKKGIIYNK